MSNIKIANLKGPAGSAGAQGAPGTVGPQGNPGLSAYSLTTAQVTIPAVGATTTVALQSVAWANVGDYVSVQGAAGSGQSAILQITAINTTNNILTLLNPVQGGGIPPASNAQPGLLNQVSGNTGDYVGGDNACHNLITTVDPEIWSVRLRSFNAVGNPNFEVDQISVGATVAAANAKLIDRWSTFKGGTAVVSAGQNAAFVTVPMTNFVITRAFYRITLTTQQASLGTNDSVALFQTVEGPYLRELASDVHSVSLLVRTSLSSLKFGLALRDGPTITKSITHLCQLSSANTWTLITVPNIPVWPGGNFNTAVGTQGYQLFITLAAGTTLTPAANDTWQNGNFYGALGQDNFAAQAVNSTFDIAFIQHEPGPLCTTLIDKPFTQNYDECLRYYTKTYDYPTAIGTVTQAGQIIYMNAATTANAYIPVRFPKPMAKVPAINSYSPATGVSNAVRDGAAGVDRGISGYTPIGLSGYGGITAGANFNNPTSVSWHYTADTGW